MKTWRNDAELYCKHVARERWTRRERRLDGLVKGLAVAAILLMYGALVCAATVMWL